MKYIITSSLCFIAIVNSIMFGWEATRRPAQDIAIINESERYVPRPDISLEEKIKSCTENGGLPNYDNGIFKDCRSKD